MIIRSIILTISTNKGALECWSAMMFISHLIQTKRVFGRRKRTSRNFRIENLRGTKGISDQLEMPATHDNFGLFLSEEESTRVGHIISYVHAWGRSGRCGTNIRPRVSRQSVSDE